MKKLSSSQQKVFDYLKQTTADGVPPTIREICLATGLKSTSTVYSHLKTLERLGYISRDHGHRSIKVSGNESAEFVPVLGNIAAGVPLFAYEEVQCYVPVPKEKCAGRELFGLHIVGESMRDIGILDGDIVICEKTSSAENGDIVAALIGDEATVKSFYKENGHFRLQPHNPDFKPIIVDSLQILGKVISLVRNY